MNEPVIVAKDISVVYRPYIDRTPTLKKFIGRQEVRTGNEVVALDNVSVTIERGETFAVIGSNGAGKSTLLRVLAGTLRPNAGVVEHTSGPPTLLQLGVGFNRSLSGRDNILLGGLAVGQPKARMEDLFDEIVEFSGLGAAIDRPVSTYSSGMRARLAFSVAMTLEPHTILIDELLTVGDTQFKERAAGAMRSLLDRAGTIVMVTHSMGRVRNEADRALWLDSGKGMMLDQADVVVDAYLESIGRGPAAPEKPIPEWSANDRWILVKRVLAGESIAEVAGSAGVPENDLKEWRRRAAQAGRKSLRPESFEDDED